jgi:hypothetical protein
LSRRLLRTLAPLVLVLAGAWLLTQIASPAPFILDDDAHAISALALQRSGSFTPPGVSGLTPSQALFWFDPRGYARSGDAVAFSALPPFYALIAQPFALFGWRGLQAMQALCFGLSLWLICGLVRRRLDDQRLALLAALTLGIGAYLLEYALGLWPHMLSLLLCTSAFALASEGLGQGRRVSLRAAAGLVVGLAVGVRYQNAVYAGMLGLGVWAFATSRWVESLGFAAGLAPPLLAYALVNKQRLGVFNPITKGPSYLRLVSKGDRLQDALWALVARFFDSSQTPGYSLVKQPWWRREPDSGALSHQGVLRKAWLQSLPWAVLPLLVAARSLGRAASPQAAGQEPPKRVDLRLIALVVGAQLAVIITFGVRRHEGLAFNQRYLIDLIPLLVHALMLGLHELGLHELGDSRRLWRGLALGAALGAAAGGLVFLLLPQSSLARQLLVLRFPLLLAALLTGAWLLRRRRPGVVAVLVGASLAWSAALHVSGDLRGSLRTRRLRHVEARALSRSLPQNEPIALFAYWGNKDCAGPLLFTHDLMVVDAHYDKGASAPGLVRQLLDQGRRVFVIVNGHGRELFLRMGAGLKVLGKRLRFAHRRPWLLVELRR